MAPSSSTNTTTTPHDHPPPPLPPPTTMVAKVSQSIPAFPPPESEPEEQWVWSQIKAESRRDAQSEPALASFLYATVLSHDSLANSLSFHLANKLCSSTLLSTLLYDLFVKTLERRSHSSTSTSNSIMDSVVADLIAVRQRDPACDSYSLCLLNFKGFLAVQSHRISHALWHQNRRPMALALQSRISDVFAVDIHPAATIGHGLLLDHATGLVVGETTVIGNNVSILHYVTLGGNGKDVGDRHPKVGDGVLIGAGATILGHVRIGKGAKVSAGALVLIDVPDGCTAVGNPARILQPKKNNSGTGGSDCTADHPGGVEKTIASLPPSESMDHTSIVEEWSDYVI